MIKIERNRTPFTRWTLGICLAFVLAAPAWAAGQSRFSGIVVFGTSLSDPGNAFVLLGDASTPPDFMLNPFLVPSAPYAKGGHHFSNGATWVEQFGRSVGLGGSARAALATNSPETTNFAVGAARAYDDGVNFNLTRQVDTFLQRSAGVASSQALYVIEIGSNDVRDAFLAYLAMQDGGAILDAALDSIAANIQRLYLAGAREFLVWVVPNIALTPAIRSLPPLAQGVAAFVTQQFNIGLAALLGPLPVVLAGTSFTRLDVDQILSAILANPAAFNMTTVATPCLTPNTPPFTCKDADEFLFWDGIHPTRAGHAILAQETANVLQ
jgi:phospholipase/lecithinase/hemolysin